MVEGRFQKLIFLLLTTVWGAMSLFSLVFGVLGIFLYAIFFLYNPKLLYDVRPWVYSMFMLSLGVILLKLSLMRLSKEAREFVKRIEDEKETLRIKMMSVEDRDNVNHIPETSEIGVNAMDIELLNIIRENGGFPLLVKRDIESSSINYDEAVKSLAKMEIKEIIRVKGPDKGNFGKIALTSGALELFNLPLVTFRRVIPTDIELMLMRAKELYRLGRMEETMITCYNAIERALKVHLIPSIDDYEKRWNEKNKNKPWKGTATNAGFNSLFNFYWGIIKRPADKDDKTKALIPKIVDYISDVRSRYAHNKLSKKSEKDAYRVLKLTELVLGMLFEDMARRVVS